MGGVEYVERDPHVLVRAHSKKHHRLHSGGEAEMIAALIVLGALIAVTVYAALRAGGDE